MTPEQLKASILQYAIQGKLVEQRPEEGTGEELYKQIQEEKQRLIKDGKIKKEKTLPEITDDEIPFDIPESWKWVRLGDILRKLTDGAHSTPRYTEIGVPFLSVKDISSGNIDFSNCKYISYIEHDELYKRCNAEKGDLLLTKVGTTGIPVIVDTDIEFSLFVSVALLKFSKEYLIVKFLKYVINSPHAQTQARGNTKGIGNKNWVLRDIANTIIPLPPRTEQKRIVTKIEELLPYVDRYAIAYEKLEQLNAKFPDDMRKSILQYSIQGKLVEQRPEEGTGEELYQKIQEEKQRLIKDGKIKKEKLLPEITDDEIPFDIPESWKWVRLGDVIDVRDGTHDSPKYVKVGIPLVTSKNLKNGVIDYENVKYIAQEDSKRINIRSRVDNNDILFAMIGSIGNPVLVKKEREFCIKNMALFKKYNNTDISMEYIYWFLFFTQNSLKKEASGGVQTFVSLFRLREHLASLPPLEEQKRIVSKIEELLPICDRLKNKG